LNNSKNSLKYELPMPKFLLASLLCLVCCVSAVAQTSEGGQFGCPDRTQFFEKPSLQFVRISQEAIEQWQALPSLTFTGFDEARYGFHQVVVYASREEVQQGGESDPDPLYRLALAVHLSGTRGQRWYQMVQPQGSIATAQTASPDELLHMQANSNMLSGQPTDEDQQSSTLGDMASLLSIRPATPVSSIPIFLLDFGYRAAGAEAAQIVANRLLLDLRNGKPQISKALQCLPAVAQAGCDVPGEPRAGYDKLRCSWDASANDFHCTLSSPFGGQYASRSASEDFYLLSSRPAFPQWYTSQTPPDLRTLAVQLSRTVENTASNIMVPQLGPVTLLGRFKDLPPGSETFIFASPGAGSSINARLWLANVSAQGVAISAINKWILSGEKIDEGDVPAGYTPAASNDRYHTTALENRPGFHALQAVLTSDAASFSSAGQDSSASHVVYWIGVEAVNGKLVASAVRVASDGSTDGSCAADSHDGTAISIEQQNGMAAATVHVRPPDALVQSSSAGDSDVPSGCVWIGGLYWKPAVGFQVRKLDQDCDAGMPLVSISEDGQITTKSEGPDQQE
jgi:hypothetical protein